MTSTRINYRETYTDEDAARARGARIRAEAEWFFNKATVAERTERDDALRALMGVTGPRADRQRSQIKAKFAFATRKARTLQEWTERTLYRGAEISKTLDDQWTVLFDRQKAKASEAA